ncbi:MAG: glycosyltransferase family 2 protein, partial [Gammaproteobacteria bacterium]|nr:glycosyltransferase family 2 protein [Gammaproteobacteria bacterium]
MATLPDHFTTVSIGMPVYNSEKWIKSAIDALLNQTYPNIELIISDNASSDNTQDLCEALARENPCIVYHRNKSNVGVTENYNRVFRASSGKYFKWASGSDLLEPTFIEQCVKYLNANPDVILVSTRTILFDGEPKNGREYEHDISADQEYPGERFLYCIDSMRRNNIMNGVFLREKLALTGLCKNYIASDINMIAELSLYGKLVTLPEFAFYRRDEKQTASSLLSSDEKLEMYKPGTESIMRLQNWRLHIERFWAVLRSSISISEKRKTLHRLSKKMFWARHDLWLDIK